MTGDHSLRWQVEDMLSVDEVDYGRIPAKDVRAVLRELQIQQIALELENRELRKSQHRLRDSRDRYRQLFDLMPDGCVVLDDDQTVRGVNEAATKLLNRDQSQLIGSPWRGFIHPDDQAAWDLQTLQPLGTTGRTEHDIRIVTGARLSIQQTSCHHSGNKLGIEASVLLVMSNAYQRDLRKNLTAGSEASSQDLKVPDQRDRLAIDASHEAIVSLSVDGIVQTWNPAAESMFGYGPQEVIGSSIVRLAPSGRQQEVEQLYSTIRTASVVDCKTQNQNSNGELLDVVVNIRQLTDASGSVTGALAIIRDVTELTRSRQELAKRDTEAAHASRLSAMGEMIAILVHEVSQPLTVISAFAHTCTDVLEKEQLSRDDLSVPIRRISQQVKRAVSIIRNLKRFLAKTAATRSSVNLNEEIREVCKLMRMQIEAHKTVVKLRLDESLPTVLADGLQLQLVLVNLVQNGLEAMNDVEPDNRRIVISARTWTDGIQVSVSDAGRGIRLDTAEKVFEPHFSTKNDGLGMGLTICERIIKAHHAVLTNAPDPDAGTTFQFILPTTND